MLESPIGSIPRQARAVEKRRRLYEAALNEFERVGVEAARVETIVAEADSGWGTFFHYFPRKEDVLLAAAVEYQFECEGLVDAMDDGTTPVYDILLATYAVLMRPKRSAALQARIWREVLAQPYRYAAMLDGRQTMAFRLSKLLHDGQARGEVRRDAQPFAMARTMQLGMIVAGAHVGEPDEPTADPVTGIDEAVATAFALLWSGIEAAAEGRPAQGPPPGPKKKSRARKRAPGPSRA